MNSLNHYLIIFGGENNQKTSFNDVIVFDTEKAEWYFQVNTGYTQSLNARLRTAVHTLEPITQPQS